MFQLSLRTLSLVCVSVLAGCGDRTGDNGDTSEPGTPTIASAASDTSATSAAFTETMQGVWLSQCVTDEDGSSALYIDVFSADDLASSATLYDGTSCSYELFEMRLSADYNFGNTRIIGSGAEVTELDVGVNRVWLKPTDLDFAAFLNVEAYCGRSDWNSDEFQVVDDCRDDLIGGTDFYSIVELDQQDLYYGDNSGAAFGTSQALRPVDIDYSIKYSRVFSDDPALIQNDANIATSRGTPTETLELYLEKVRSIEFSANRN